MEPAMPCKKENHLADTPSTELVRSLDASQLVPKTKYGCRVESHEYTRQRAEPSLPKRNTSMTQYKSVHKFVLLPQAKNIPDAKLAVDKEWKKLETSPVWQLDKVRSKKEGSLAAQRDKKNVHFATLMDICHLKKHGVGTPIPEVQRQSRSPW